jgi:hypothetical protein
MAVICGQMSVVHYFRCAGYPANEDTRDIISIKLSIYTYTNPAVFLECHLFEGTSPLECKSILLHFCKQQTRGVQEESHTILYGG